MCGYGFLEEGGTSPNRFTEKLKIKKGLKLITGFTLCLPITTIPKLFQLTLNINKFRMTISWYIDSLRKHFHNQVKIEYAGVSNLVYPSTFFCRNQEHDGRNKD